MGHFSVPFLHLEGHTSKYVRRTYKINPTYGWIRSKTKMELCSILILQRYKTPTKWADLSEEGAVDLWLPTKSATEALEMRNGVQTYS